MLSGFDIAVLGVYEDWGDLWCIECARKNWSTLTVEKAVMGLATSAELNPVIRYTLVEEAIESGFQDAVARLVRFREEHPAFSALLVPDDVWPIETQIVCRFAFWEGRQFCGECAKPLLVRSDYFVPREKTVAA